MRLDEIKAVLLKPVCILLGRARVAGRRIAYGGMYAARFGYFDIASHLVAQSGKVISFKIVPETADVLASTLARTNVLVRL